MIANTADSKHASTDGAPCASADVLGPIVVVIVTFNGGRWIEPCLRSLVDQGVGKIIVVDNASEDNTIAIIRERFPASVVIALDCNRGFGGANNIGIQRALDEGARAIVLLNQDTVVESGAIARLVGEMRRSPEYGVLGAFHVDYEGTSIDGPFRNYAPGKFWDHLFRDRVEPVYQVDFLPANALLVRREVFESVGGFDPLFFMYGEDRDWCERVVAGDWTIGLVPRAVVRHWHGVSHTKRDYRWLSRFEYRRALLHLKRSKRWLPLSYAGLLANYVRRMELVRGVCRVLAFVRCVLQWRRLASSRSRIPYAFQVGSHSTDRSTDEGARSEAPVAEAQAR